MLEVTRKAVYAPIILLFFSAVCTAQNLEEAAPGQPINQAITLTGGSPILWLSLNISLDESNPYWLYPGTNATKRGSMMVTAGRSWVITVTSDRQDGKMAQSGANGYIPGGKKLGSSLRVKAGDSAQIDLGKTQGGVLISGASAVQNETIPLTFTQSVTWRDGALPGGQVYSIYTNLTISLTI